MTDLNKRVIDLTAGELLELIQQGYKPQVLIDTTEAPQGKYVYGLAGIAKLLGCSITTANRIKQSDKLNGAITQIGNLIITDAEKALELSDKKYIKHSKK